MEKLLKEDCYTEDAVLQKINNYLDSQKENALRFLEEIVNIDSFSYDKDGVNRVGAVIRKRLEDSGIPYEIRENGEFGDHIIAVIKGKKQGKILLMGHQDTPHPPGTTLQRPFKIEGNLLRGPGVSDMKAGLVSMINAAIALQEFAYEEMCDIELLFTPEEEIGSPISRNVIAERAKDALAVFNLEAARPDGSIVTSRKGSAHMKIEIEGRAAHAGAFIEDGISANDELALKMVKIKQLMDDKKGTTVNFGKIEGGISNNMVSPYAVATIHSAFWSEEDFNELYDQIKEIVATPYIPGTKSKLTGGIGIQPMEKHEGVSKMYNVVQKAAEVLNLTITEQRTKGAADAGFTASLGVPTICGMGPVGGNWHAVDEYMELDTFIPRMKLLANSILLFVRESKL
ncbi:M20/M25/M40 family metallo-hydrolase [Bacillus aerolatus]|uniref:M20/M25/M40 family metallo-hydrolase n=1 Tax=Bacillus aerolatus TaxID=2653354 RepID=A0A6I1FR90_9BACI|nr:M20 family metallopeptidase [Bacillus aerolatus]KAB7707088.1 M20/M25/M40 family metallo-hydrolase [Bacillus aerolatus]